jgi:hypothetical protein
MLAARGIKQVGPGCDVRMEPDLTIGKCSHVGSMSFTLAGRARARFSTVLGRKAPGKQGFIDRN